MISFFKKDFLIYWRDRKEIIISLITPILIIIVLGFALPGWVENPTKSVQMTVAIVELDDETKAMQQFRDSLSLKSLSNEAALAIEQELEGISPTHYLMQVLQDEYVKEMVKLQTMSAEEALEQLHDDQIDAIITIPADFTIGALSKMLLNEGDGATIHLTADKASLAVDVLANIIDGFITTLNFQSALNNVLGEEVVAAATALEGISEVGGRESIPGVITVTSFQYYALALSIIFALFVSTTTASKAITEKRERTFQRILLTGTHPVKYLSGKMSSTFCISLLGNAVVLLVTHFILNIFPERSLTFWLGMSAVFVMLALCVGALSALFTALVFRLQDSAATGIAFIITMIAGTIGGSFVPIYALPEWLKKAGEWTPNGLTLSVLLQWIQTESLSELFVPIVKLAVFAIVTVGIAIWCFPRRGRI